MLLQMKKDSRDARSRGSSQSKVLAGLPVSSAIVACSLTSLTITARLMSGFRRKV